MRHLNETLYKNIKETLVHFAKMKSSNFQENFSLFFWHKIQCIVINEKKNFLLSIIANHTISIYGKTMTIIF